MILAFDTATDATVVALAGPEGVMLGGADHHPDPGERPGHTSQLLPLAVDVLAQAGASWQDLTAVAVGAGPGGFTGLRVGLATGRALQLALGLAARPLVSLDALAAGAPGRPRAAIFDGRRGELFVRCYSDDGTPEGSARLTPRDDPGPVEGRLCIGSGAIVARELLSKAGAEVPEAGDPRHRIGPGGLAQAAFEAASGELVPLYLREPDAEPRAT